LNKKTFFLNFFVLCLQQIKKYNMTPKEKALEVLNLFGNMHNFFAKDFAIMYVDTILIQDEYKNEIQFWQEVKKEIEQL
jgi:hypothetical protein